MEGWNYRVVKRIKNGHEFYGIHEAHYENGEVVAITDLLTVESFDEGLKGLRWQLNKMKEALKKEVLDYADFK